jgi:hypothetical protein
MNIHDHRGPVEIVPHPLMQRPVGSQQRVRDNLNGPSVIMNIHIPDGPARMCRQPARPAPGERA